MPLQVINGIGRVGIRVASPAVSYDADAQAFITAAALTDTTQKNAINELVLDLKAAGVWTKMKALYPMVGGTATTHKWNLKDPRDLDVAFRLTFFGGGTHSTNGYLPNGSTAYAELGTLNMNTISSSNYSLGYYSRTNAGVGTYYDCGATNNVDTGWYTMNPKNGLGNLIYQAGSIAFSYANTNSQGFYQAGTNSNSLTKVYKNGNIFFSDTTTQTKTPFNQVFNIGRSVITSGGGYYSNRELGLFYISTSLTDLESNLFYQIVEKYQYALGRNINATQSFYFNRNYSNETNAFIFNGGITDATQQSAVNTLVNTLKTANIWTKMKAVYPMVGGTATAHKFNLVNPVDSDAAFRLTFVGGGTHSSNGYQPNGTNAYANTFLVPSSVLQTNSTHISFYSRTNNDTGFDIGINSNATSGRLYMYIKLTNSFGGRKIILRVVKKQYLIQMV